MLILQALTDGAMHGYGVAPWIEERTEGTLIIEEGSLYPAHYRMEKRGWVESHWGASENKRRARYYEMTDAGRKQLDTEIENRARLVWAKIGLSRYRQPEISIEADMIWRDHVQGRYSAIINNVMADKLWPEGR